MTKQDQVRLSVVVPVYNERPGLAAFHKSLVDALVKLDSLDYEIIYCDDGSSDGTDELVREWHTGHSRIKLLKLSRHFGKESALAAAIAAANGQAILMLDGDGQHPVELIPEFVEAWQAGAQV